MGSGQESKRHRVASYSGSSPIRRSCLGFFASGNTFKGAFILFSFLFLFFFFFFFKSETKATNPRAQFAQLALREIADPRSDPFERIENRAVDKDRRSSASTISLRSSRLKFNDPRSRSRALHVFPNEDDRRRSRNKFLGAPMTETRGGDSSLKQPLGHQDHDQVRCQAGDRRGTCHPDVAVLQQHRVDHVDDTVGALDVRAKHSNPVAVPLDLVTCKEKRSRSISRVE